MLVKKMFLIHTSSREDSLLKFQSISLTRSEISLSSFAVSAIIASCCKTIQWAWDWVASSSSCLSCKRSLKTTARVQSERLQEEEIKKNLTYGLRFKLSTSLYNHVIIVATLRILLLLQVLHISRTCSSKMHLIQSSPVCSVLTAKPQKDSL